VYQVGINKGIILRCTAHQISRSCLGILFVSILCICSWCIRCVSCSL